MNNEPAKAEIIGLTQKDEQRVERLNKYAQKVEEQYKEIEIQAQNDQFTHFSEDEIRWHLQHDPNMIAEAGLFLAKIERAYGYAKIDSKVILAEVWNEANRQKEYLSLSNAEDRKNWVQVNPRYLKAVRQELEWKYQLERMKIIYSKYENIFTGTRKLATLMEKDNANNYRIEKYDV